MLHTDIPTASVIRELAEVREPSCVSIYVPTSPISSETQSSRIELKNHLATALAELESSGASRERLAEFEESISDLLDDSEFWNYQSYSLVVLSTPERTLTYRLPNRLPSVVDVSDRFFLKPLFRAATFPQTAFVLAISQNSVRLVEVTADSGAYPLAVEGLPRDAASAVGLESISGRAPSGRIQGSEGQKVRLRQYSRAVDSAIRSTVTNSGVPLILAATEPLIGIYRSVNSYSGLVPETIDGNPDELTADQLAASARPVLDALYARQLEALKSRISDLLGEGLAVTDIGDLARAATFGAVDTLLFDIDGALPGSIDDQTGVVTLDDSGTPNNYGVIDEIVRRSALSGAKIFAVRAEDVPGGAQAAASVRFPV